MPNFNSDIPVRVGILGAARIAPTALFEPARQRTDVEIRCIAARDPLRARAYADEHRIPETASSYEELIARTDIDLIYVALPAALHARWAIAALDAGKPVLCEKPFALSSEQAQLMVEAGRRNGKVLLEAFHYRHHDIIARAIDIVRNGVLGSVTECEAFLEYEIPHSETEIRWNALQGGGALMDMGCYTIHVLRTLLDSEPTVLSAKSDFSHGVDSETEAKLLFPDNIRASIRCSMISKKMALNLRIQGTRGTLEISNYIAPHLGCEFKTRIDGHENTVAVSGPTTFEAQLAHVIEVLRGRVSPLTGGEDAIKNMNVVEAVKKAAA